MSLRYTLIFLLIFKNSSDCWRWVLSLWCKIPPLMFWNLYRRKTLDFLRNKLMFVVKVRFIFFIWFVTEAFTLARTQWFSIVNSPKLEDFFPFMLLRTCLGVISKFLWPTGVPNHFDHFMTAQLTEWVQCKTETRKLKK